LVRTLCKHCKAPYEPVADDVPPDFPWEEYRQRGEPLFEPRGCRECRHTGYAGRVGLYELLVTNDEIRHLANERIASQKLKQAATKSGMQTLRQNGWRKVLLGRTSIEEMTRVAKAD
jgi:general secretion pathway protein E/type IV pilus assembly protein PilB